MERKIDEIILNEAADDNLCTDTCIYLISGISIYSVSKLVIYKWREGIYKWREPTSVVGRYLPYH